MKTQNSQPHLQALGCAAFIAALFTPFGLGTAHAASDAPDLEAHAGEASIFSKSLRFEGEVVEVLPNGRVIRETAIHRGKRLRWTRKVENRVATPERLSQPTEAAASIDELSVAELAENLRGLMLFGDHEFIEAEPAWDLAHRVKLIRELELAGVTDDFIASLIPSGAPSQGRIDLRSEVGGDPQGPAQIVHGTDDRDVMLNMSYPHRAQIVFDNTRTDLGINGSQGSGSLIGPSTIASVAHVFWDEDNDTWEASFLWAPGYDSEDADPNPWGEFGCYAVTIPGAYPNNESDNEYDYAVVDTDVGCNIVRDGVNSDEPGATVGWLGWYAASTSAIEGTTGYVRGYPGSTQTCGNPGVPCNTRVWGDTSSALENDRNGKVIRHQADTSGMMSGSGFYHYADPTCGGCDHGAYVVGFHRAGSAPYNLARRLGGTIANFIEDNSSDY